MFCKQINLSEEEKNSIGILLDGKEYSAQQFHFHFKSEHQIDSQQFPLEMHIVHKSAQGNFAVVGVLYEITKETGLRNATKTTKFKIIEECTKSSKYNARK